jgi:glycosyltransferase involved in cell wall biosynthesis
VIGVVVPVHNRMDNLDLLLMSLERQTCSDFQVVIADDGSTDQTRELVDRRAKTSVWGGRLGWVGCGPHQGVRTGRARNIGAANLHPETSLLIMLDSDVILQDNAIAQFRAVHVLHSSHVILGLVEWLPPLSRTALVAAVRSGDLAGIRSQVPSGKPHRVKGTFTGPELREGLYDLDPGHPVRLRAEWALPINSGWPLALYWKVGGFDETMRGYGYQDMDLGVRASKGGARCVARPELWALHVWHPKPPTAMMENQRNLDLYLRRHGSNRVIETDVDWRLWWHYHAERGGAVAWADGALWAISGDHRHRLALPDLGWLEQLGHCSHGLEERALSDLERMEDCGSASDDRPGVDLHQQDA